MFNNDVDQLKNMPTDDENRELRSSRGYKGPKWFIRLLSGGSDE